MKSRKIFSKKGKMVNYIKNLKYLSTFLRSNEVGFIKKIEVIFLILMMSIYLISPIDLVPDFIPIFGYMEDAVVVFSMLSYAGKIVSRYMFSFKPESETIKSSNKRGKNVIDVTFTDIIKESEKKIEKENND